MPVEENILVNFTDATVANGEAPVLYEVNFDIHKGDFVYIVGKVGSGKTSIIRSIIAENPLQGGSATVCGMDLTKIKGSQISRLRRKIGVVFQDFQLLMDRSVHDNLEFVLKCTLWKDERNREKRIDQVLNAVGMTTKKHKMPYQLSGGEQQRIAIARALLNNPQLIIADEPTGNLDSDTADEIMLLLRAINTQIGTAVIMVTHNNQIVERYPGRVLECRDEHCTEITKE